MLLVFVPMYFAVSSLTRVSHSRAAERQAQALARSVAGHLGEAAKRRPNRELEQLVEAQLAEPVGGLALYSSEGVRLALRHNTSVRVEQLPLRVERRDRQESLQTSRGPAMLFVVPSGVVTVAVLVHVDVAAAGAGPLVGLFSLYMGIVILAVMVLLYFGLTRIVISPIQQLSAAAGRVATGARTLRASVSGGREFENLARDLSTMTDRLRTDEEALKTQLGMLRATTEELQSTQRTLVRSERLASVGRLASGLAHEVGNPVAAIMSLQELLLDDDLTDEQRDFVERMHRETKRVHRVMRDLLAFARADQPDLEDDTPAECDVAAAIEQVASLMRPQRSFANVELHVVVDDELPLARMRGDQLEQVLINLLLNAAHAAPETDGRITVVASATEAFVEVTVTDNGPGISPDVIDRLFEPFTTTKEAGEGTGLGLAVCRGLIEGVGGTIDVDTTVSGAKFVIQLLVGETTDER